MAEEQRNTKSDIIALANRDVVLRWSVAGFFFLMHSSIIAQVTENLNPGDFMYHTACAGGFLLGLLWMALTYRLEQWVALWVQVLRNYENQHRSEFRIIGDNFVQVESLLRSRILLYTLSFSASFLWILLFLRPFLPLIQLYH
jgi:hypothetical protein